MSYEDQLVSRIAGVGACSEGLARLRRQMVLKNTSVTLIFSNFSSFGKNVVFFLIVEKCTVLGYDDA